MTFDTLVTIILAVLGVLSYTGMKLSEHFTFGRFHDQKVVVKK